MKTLHLIRHGKSSWADSELTDELRPLKSRGRKDAQLIGDYLNENSNSIERLYSSNAVRAHETAEIIAEHLTTSPISVNICPELYSFDWQRVLAWIHKLDNNLSEVAIVTHNPAITDLVNSLALSHYDNIPTCAVGRLNLLVNKWSEVDLGLAVLEALILPKELRT